MTHHSFVCFPNEPMAVLSLPGGSTVQFGYTFLHYLNGLLAGIKYEDKPPYERDFAELRCVLESAEHQLQNASRTLTDKEETILRERYHAYGRGYWSSWMNEDCPWSNDSAALGTTAGELLEDK